MCERKFTELNLLCDTIPQRTISSMFGSPNSKCPGLCYIYCKLGEQLLALCWWAGQVSSTEHPCNWLLPHVVPPWNGYLACWKSNIMTFAGSWSQAKHSSFPPFVSSWCSSGRLFMVEACGQVLKSPFSHLKCCFRDYHAGSWHGEDRTAVMYGDCRVDGTSLGKVQDIISIILKTIWALASDMHGQWETMHKEAWKYRWRTFADVKEWRGLEQEGIWRPADWKMVKEWGWKGEQKSTE